MIMISTTIKDMVKQLDSYDKAMLIEFIYENLYQNEDDSILNSWVNESEERLKAVKDGRLKLKDYETIKSQLS
jgi:hypothetical protein